MADHATLRDEPIGPNTAHICVDMQRMYQEDTPWALAWMPKILPNIVALCEAKAADNFSPGSSQRAEERIKQVIRKLGRCGRANHLVCGCVGRLWRNTAIAEHDMEG